MIDRAGVTRYPPGLLACDGPDEMGRELASGPDTVEATLSGLARQRRTVSALLGSAPAVHVLGTGAPLAAARSAEPLLRAADRAAGRRRPLVVREAAAVVMGSPGEQPYAPGDCVVAVTKSGISPEVLGAARRAVAAGAHLIAVTSSEDSALAQLADQVVPVPIGEERGAATKSALGALAALLAMWNLVEPGSPASSRLIRLLRSTVNEWELAWGVGAELAAARRIWTAGFGCGLGIAEAESLLWHEKVGRPAVAATPSAFRHGPIEAAGNEDAILLIEIEPPSAVRDGYMRLLSGECLAVGVKQVWLSHAQPPAGPWLALRAAKAPERLLEALLRVQQLARAAAHAAGSYRDGFAILASLVRTSTAFE